MSKLTYVAAFALGFAAGTVIFKIRQDREAAKPAKPETDDILEQFSEAVSEDPQEPEKPAVTEEQTKDEYMKIVNEYKPNQDTSDRENSPYIISPMEYGDFEDYQTISLTYTSDGVLLDDEYDPVEELDETVGKDYAKFFGSYPDDPDTVYIRNDALCSDFEICKDLRSADEFYKLKPHMRWRDDE